MKTIKALITYSLLLIPYYSVNAQTGCISGDCGNGIGTRTYYNGDKYVGEWTNYKCDGQGTYYYRNGDKYSGGWMNGTKSGHGIYYWANGDKFEGTWSGGKRNGRGTFYYATGRTYSGEWVEDMPKGQTPKFYAQKGCVSGDCGYGTGTCIYFNGDKYVGEWKDYKYNGQGTYYYANGDEYVGQYTNGKRNGYGTYYWTNGAKYSGEWVEGKRLSPDNYGNSSYGNSQGSTHSDYDNNSGNETTAITQSKTNNQQGDTTKKIITAEDKLNNDAKNFELEVNEKLNSDTSSNGNNTNLSGGNKMLNDEKNFESEVNEKQKADSLSNGTQQGDLNGDKTKGQGASVSPYQNNCIEEWKDKIPFIHTKTDNSNSFAVIIGNRDYQTAKIDSFAINDAKAIKYFLIHVLGYKEGNIYYQENATQSAFETYFGSKENPQGKLYNNIKPGISDVFIYYAGHGAPGEKDTNGYFIPVDCDPQYIMQGGYSRSLFYSNLSQLRAKSITVVTDACFSGEDIEGNTSGVNITRKNSITRDSNFVVLSSSTSSQKSTWYNAKGHGLFTYFFLNALMDENRSDENKNGKLTYKEIFDYVSDQTNGVPYYARSIHGIEQTPTIEGKGFDNVFVEYK